jgi:hypothetical protein
MTRAVMPVVSAMYTGSGIGVGVSVGDGVGIEVAMSVGGGRMEVGSRVGVGSSEGISAVEVTVGAGFLFADGRSDFWVKSTVAA